MRAAVKEVEHLERIAREEAGLPVEAEEGKTLPPIDLSPYRDMQRERRRKKKEESEKERNDGKKNKENWSFFRIKKQMILV